MQDQKQEKDIATIFSGTATKASGSTVGFEIGRERGTDTLFLRIVQNNGGGTFTKAWQPLEALRGALEPFRKAGKGLRFAEALGPAIPQKGRNNAPFVGYALASLGLLAADAEKPGEYQVAGDWDAWRKQMLALPVPEPPPPAPAPEAAAAPTAPEAAAAPAAASKGKAGGKKQKAAASPSSPSSPAPAPEAATATIPTPEEAAS